MSHRTMQRSTVSRTASAAWLAAILILGLAGCVTPSHVPRVTTAPPGGGHEAVAQQFGEGAVPIMTNPRIDQRVRALFGADWAGAAPGGTRAGAPEFFTASAPPQLLEIGGAQYVAVTGCRASACGRDRGLLLIRADGAQVLARLDEGGFSHYYGQGPVDMDGRSLARLNAAWAELEEQTWVSGLS